MKANQNGVVQLQTSDWLWIVCTAIGATVALGTLHITATTSLRTQIEAVEKRADERFERLRSELNTAAPAPAKWTVEAVARIERQGDRTDQQVENLHKQVLELRERMLKLERIK